MNTIAVCNRGVKKKKRKGKKYRGDCIGSERKVILCFISRRRERPRERLEYKTNANENLRGMSNRREYGNGSLHDPS